MQGRDFKIGRNQEDGRGGKKEKGELKGEGRGKTD